MLKVSLINWGSFQMTAIAKDYTRWSTCYEEQCYEFSAIRHLKNIDLLQYLQIEWFKNTLE